MAIATPIVKTCGYVPSGVNGSKTKMSWILDATQGMSHFASLVISTQNKSLELTLTRN